MIQEEKNDLAEDEKVIEENPKVCEPNKVEIKGSHLSLESCEEESAEEDVVDGLGMEKDSGVRAEVHFEFCNDT